MHWGLKDTMSALFLKTHALKVRRGQAGRVRAGKLPRGLSYGYRVVRKTEATGELVRGEREIVDAEAEVVPRIFRDTIAGLLNAWANLPDCSVPRTFAIVGVVAEEHSTFVMLACGLSKSASVLAEGTSAEQWHGM
jgi:hypothetical protein